MHKTFRIVVGVDGSEHAQRALDWAVVEAAHRHHAGQPTTVQAIIAWQPEMAPPPVAAFAHISDPRAVADAVLSAAVATARVAHPDVAVAGLAVEGAPADVVGRAADGADLLVVGSHGHGHPYQRAVGAVTEACIRDAICPVVVIPASRSSSTSFAGESLAATAG
jgi:nucleotide-binding universal stress UspA family protein